MKRKVVSGIVSILLLMDMLILTFSVQLSEEEESKHIDPDVIGSEWLATTDWNKTYGGTNGDYACSVVQTNDGGYAIAGYTYSYGVGAPSYSNFWLVKTDLAGNVAWSKTYGGNLSDYAYSVVQTSDGGYALAGSTAVVGNNDFLLVKTDSAGNQQWSRTYGGASYEYAYSVVQTSDGGYALAGYTQSYGAGAYDFWLVKTDSSGNLQWNRTYGGTGSDAAMSVVKTNDGGYALSGYTNSYGAGSYDFWLVKTDSSGIMQWSRTYGGTGSDAAVSLIQTGDGGYAIVGTYGAGSIDFWLVKTSSTGNQQWNKTYGGTNSDNAYSVVQTSDGGYALAGYTASYGAGSPDFWLVNADALGNLQWSRTYGGTGTEIAYSLIRTSDGGYALAGYTNSYGAGSCDFWLIKLTPLTIYIRADGSVDPPTAPIGRSGDLYTLTDNIYTETDGIVIQRNNMTLDGAGYTLQGNINNTGILLSGRSNVTIKNMRITAYDYGIWLASSNDNSVTENNITANNDASIVLYSSANNIIVGNNITANLLGVWLAYSSGNSVSGNNIENNWDGIQLYSSSGNSVGGNNITANNGSGIVLYSSANNTMCVNNITANNYIGLYLFNSSDNRLYHNNFIDNINQAYSESSANVWDDGYPSGGNYWSDYTGVDAKSGPNQDLPGSDGIGDTPYVIDAHNQDNYPFMEPSAFAYTPTGLDVTLTLTEDVTLTFDQVSSAGFASLILRKTGPPLPPGVLSGPYYDIQTSASFIGTFSIAITYNDTGLTLEQENALQFIHWDDRPIPGDITGPTRNVPDGKVDIRDIALVALYFGRNVPPAPPNCDLSGPTPGVPDGKIDTRDIAFVCKNFGKAWHWDMVTTSRDPVNNIIYGQDDHLSIFGVR